MEKYLLDYHVHPSAWAGYASTPREELALHICQESIIPYRVHKGNLFRAKSI